MTGSTPTALHTARHEPPTIGIVLVAAGRGERLGAGTPKAFVELAGVTLLEHCVTTIAQLPHRGHVTVVVPDELAAEALVLVERTLTSSLTWEVSVVPGGRERHESVLFGLDALPPHIEVVLVHDAARPLAPRSVFERVIDAVHSTGGAIIPVLPVADTLKRVGADGVVHETVDRTPLVAVQTPQGFPREVLAAAHDSLRLQHGTGTTLPTDDAEVVQRAGSVVRTVPGDTLAHKLTTPGDLALLEALYAAQHGGAER